MNTLPQKKFKILIVGDSCTDIYQFGTVDRISPEAPIPIFVPTYQYTRPGMASNVAENFKALGCTIELICGQPSEKTRLIDQRSRQQMLRVDRDIQSLVLDFDTSICKNFDAVVVSDYNKGSVDYNLMSKIISSSTGPVFVDTKKTNLDPMRGAWVKINELEYNKITNDCPGLIVTRGAQGADIIHHGISCAAPKVEVVDVTGAGDTFLAALAYCYLIDQNIKNAVEFAIRAASITVQHLGVYAPSLKEIQ
jgi:bifunctional ADP-heptose synthase (sugar kinase/adenylyltransferase)